MSQTNNRMKEKIKVDVTDILTKYKAGSHKEFDLFVSTLADEEVEDDVLIGYFRGLRECITFLSKDFEHLVGIILKVKWSFRDSALVQEYQSLILNLISAQTFYLKACIKSLIQSFMPKIIQLQHNEDFVPDEQTRHRHEQSFMNIHAVLKAVASIVPMTPTVITPLLTDCYPFIGKDVYILQCYVKNLLTLSQYMPNLRQQILELIVERLMKLDVQCSRHEIAENSDDDVDSDSDNECFAMDDDAVDSTEQPSSENQKMSHKEANKLDLLMDLMYQFVQHTCSKNGELDWEATKKLYREFLLVFEKIILPTYASCHVQFLMFYICSYKQPLVEGFIDYLWKKVQEPNAQTMFRQVAVAYIASLLARAKYVDMGTVTACLDLMCTWLHRYINQASPTSQADLLHHGAFYSVCQAVFYIFIFRHKELLETKKGIKYTEGLNFQSIVTSRLNPLNICLPIIVRTFASVTRQYQLAFCDTIIERNNRCSLPVVNDHGPNGLSCTNLLDSFFPFDPYLLLTSSSYIRSLYREYSGSVELKEEEPIIEEDDFLMAATTTESSSIAIKGSAEKSPVDFLQYGTSPGFMHG